MVLHKETIISKQRNGLARIVCHGIKPIYKQRICLVRIV